MKKKLMTLFLICTLVFSLLAGCGPVDREKQESYRKLGISQLQEGNYIDAVTNFQKALDESLGKIGPYEVDICYYKALAQFKSGDINGAIDTYTSLIEYDEKNAECYYLRGCVYLQAAGSETDSAKAEELADKGIYDYNKAVSIDGNNYDLYLSIYENLTALGKETYAQEFLSRALGLACETGQDYCDQGHVYLMLGDYEKAETLLNTGLEKGCDESMLYLAQICKEQGDVEKAREYILSYSEKYPQDVDALHEGAILALNAGQYKEAVQMLEQAYEYADKGTNQELQLDLIYAYEYDGQFNKAYELMGEYLKLYPGDSEAAREYEFLKTRTGTGKTPAERAQEEKEKEEQAQNDASTTDAEDDSSPGNTDSTENTDNESEGATIEGAIIM